MRIVQVVPRIFTESSGPSVSVPSLCKAIANRGESVRLFALEPRPENEIYKADYFPTAKFPGAYRLGVSKSMKQHLRCVARESDVIHSHSIWMMPNIYPEIAVRNTSCKLVVSPRGSVSTWALRRSRIRKKIVWWYGQKRALEAASCFHVTCEQECNEIRDLGLKQPVAIVPNGVAIPSNLQIQSSDAPEKTLLYLARIHPKKGADVLLNAWRFCNHAFPDWNLVIAGPNQNAFARELMKRVETERIPRVTFPGEVNGITKSELFASASLYVLPTHSENFGISVAEAMAHGIPAIVTKGAPWQGLQGNNAGWWIDIGVEPLIVALKKSMSRSQSDLNEMGVNARTWMMRDFEWNAVGNKMIQVYQYLVGAIKQPDFVVSY